MQLPPATTTTTEAAADDILDVLEPASLPVHEFPWLAVLIGAAILALAAIVIYAWRRRRRPQAVESLEQRARRRLQQLAAFKAGDARAFHADLAAVLVQYAEERLGLRGTRLTSVEILREFQRNGVMPAAWQESLASFLRDCDRAKFAPDLELDWDPSERIARCRALFEELAANAAAAPKLASPWEGWSNATV